MNRIDLLGNLTKDVELTKAGEVSLARFTLAVNRPYKNKEGKYDADFIQLKAWREQAETIAKYAKKGDKLRIEGRIETSTYEKDGAKQYSTEFIVTGFEFLSGKKEEVVESK